MPSVTIYLDKQLYFKLQKAVEKTKDSESKIMQQALQKYLKSKR